MSQTAAHGSVARTAAWLGAVAALAALGLVAAGWWPTLAIGGPGAWRGLVAGCLIGWAAGVAGGVPVALGLVRSGSGQTIGLLAGVVVRLVVALVLVGVALMSGAVPPRATLVWAGLAYVVLVGVETAVVTQRLKLGAQEARR